MNDGIEQERAKRWKLPPQREPVPVRDRFEPPANQTTHIDDATWDHPLDTPEPPEFHESTERPITRKDETMELDRFAITEDHVKLVHRMNIGWDGCEFGAPAVDCKRPYGNGNVYRDIAEILGIPVPNFDDGDDWEQADIGKMDRLHKETRTVLQIGVCVGYFRAGEYQSEKYRDNWRPVEGVEPYRPVVDRLDDLERRVAALEYD